MTVPKLKVMTIVGTRPEIIRLSRVMVALDRAADHIVVDTGQNYDHELSGIFFEEMDCESRIIASAPEAARLRR